MISALHNEIEQLYNRLFCQDIRSVAICASQTKEGATTIATLLAQHCLLMGKKTLLVDMNVYNPSFERALSIGLEESDTAIGSNDLLIAQQSDDETEQTYGEPALISLEQMALVGITAPKRKDLILALRNESVLKKHIEQWHSEFDCIIVDTTALNRVNHNNIPGDYVAKACDSAILVVEAGRTPEEMIAESLSRLNKMSVNLVGTVINDRHNPPLKNELLRKLKHFKYLPKIASCALKKWITESKLLNLSV